MYCLQWLIPVLLIPNPVNPAWKLNHDIFIICYLFGFFIEKRPCTLCSLIFFVAACMLWQNFYGPSWNYGCESEDYFI